MKVSIALTVPSTYNADKELTAEQYAIRVNRVQKTIAKFAGGFTTIDGLGGWYSDDLQKLITEKVKVVSTITDAENTEEILSLARRWRDAWKQEAVLVTVTPIQAYFV